MLLASGYNNVHPNCGHSISVYVPALADDPRRDQERSNRPFEDNRSERQRQAYLEGQSLKRQQRETRDQWERYRLLMPDEVPGLASFASMKARDTDRYHELMSDYREARREIGKRES